DGEVKKPGPNQRFKRASIVNKIEARSNNQRQNRRSTSIKVADQRVRRRIVRSKQSTMGAKAKSKN
ncbi:MAG TPA: DUF5350 family protein, partial [Methanocorpusculum sp.]|nr:DUF5350 family protein [Methanocorpusculum sp.]